MLGLYDIMDDMFATGLGVDVETYIDVIENIFWITTIDIFSFKNMISSYNIFLIFNIFFYNSLI